MQPKAEAEVAFAMGRDLDDPDLALRDVVAAVEYVLPAIEIVGSRIRDWNIKLLDTIADNASSGCSRSAPRRVSSTGSTFRRARWRWSGEASACPPAPAPHASAIP